MGPEKDSRTSKAEDHIPSAEVATPASTRQTSPFLPLLANRRVRAPIQAKLQVGAAGDRYEQEADRVAAAVMRDLHQVTGKVEPTTSKSNESQHHNARRRVQRMTGPKVIGLEGGEVDSDTDTAIRNSTGGGSPLAGRVRGQMEQSFGADFSRVRVHADNRADDLNRRIQAKAFTTGSDIFFSKGAYNPTSRRGQELLAHELTHVVQQGGAGIARHPLIRRAERDQTSEPTTVSKSSAGGGRSKLTLYGSGGALGSVTVGAGDASSVEATDLSVTPGHRGYGYGSDLVSAAARVGEKSGKSSVSLGSQDDGSGRLDHWYKSLGFNQTGKVAGGFSKFEAPTSTLQPRRVQRSTNAADRTAL